MLSRAADRWRRSRSIAGSRSRDSGFAGARRFDCGTDEHRSSAHYSLGVFRERGAYLMNASH